MDGKAKLTSEDDTRRHPMDGREPTHNRLLALRVAVVRVAVHQAPPDGYLVLAGLDAWPEQRKQHSGPLSGRRAPACGIWRLSSNPSRLATTGHPTGLRASDLPAAVPHTASQHPISLSSIRPATCSSMERSEVPRCPPNGPTIDGKDGSPVRFRRGLHTKADQR
jgi:hypothetical protein